MKLRIRELREDQDLKQKTVAGDLMCDQSLYSKYERGERPLPLEMAERLAAAFDCKDYGALSVRTQYLYDVKIIRVVPPTVFYPQPKVESAVVQFDLKKDVDMDMRFRKRLSSVTKTAFLQRRKQMCKVLSGNFDRTRVESAFEKLGIRPEVRPAALTVEDFVKLTRELM